MVGLREMDELSEDNRLWMLNKENHNVLVRYLKHQKSPLANLAKGERIKNQYIKFKTKEATLKFKLIIASSVVDDKKLIESLEEIRVWLKNLVGDINISFSNVIRDGFSKEEELDMENKETANEFIRAVKMAEEKYQKKKRSLPSDEKDIVSESKRSMHSIEDGFKTMKSSGSIDSEIFDKCMNLFSEDEEEEDSETVRDSTLKDDRDIDESWDNLEKLMEKKFSQDTNLSGNKELKEELEIIKLITNSRITKLEDTVQSFENASKQMEIKIQSLNEDLVIMKRSHDKMIKVMTKTIEKINTNVDGVTKVQHNSSVELSRYRETILQQRLELLPIFSGKESFVEWREKYDTTLKEFEEVKLPYFLLYEWLIRKTEGEANRVVKKFSIYKEHSHKMAWQALAEKFHDKSENLIIIERINSIGKASIKSIDKLESAYYIIIGAMVKSSYEQQENYVDIIYSSILDNNLQQKFENWKKTHRREGYVEQMKSFLQEQMNKPPEVIEKEFPVSSLNGCWVCNKDHSILSCQNFKTKPMENRITLVRLFGACWNCLERGHIAKDCPKKECECGKKSNKLVHNCKSNSNSNTFVKNYPLFSDYNSSKSVNYLHINRERAVVMADTGAAISLITTDLIKRLNLNPIGKKYLSLEGVGNKSYLANIHKILINDKEYIFFEFPKLGYINQKAYGSIIPSIGGRIEVLIGHDNYELICPKMCKYLKNSILVETPIGYFLYNKRRKIPINLMVKREQNDKPISINSEDASKKLEREIQVTNGKIFAPLMLKENKCIELCSINIAKQRLLTQLKCFLKNKDYETQYDTAVYAYIDDGYAMEIPEYVEPKNYIPHHLVLTEGKNPGWFMHVTPLVCKKCL